MIEANDKPLYIYIYKLKILIDQFLFKNEVAFMNSKRY